MAALERLSRHCGKDGFLAGCSIGCCVMITIMPRKYESGLSFVVWGFRRMHFLPTSAGSH
jgi:hypothetical protein